MVNVEVGDNHCGEVSETAAQVLGSYGSRAGRDLGSRMGAAVDERQLIKAAGAVRRSAGAVPDVDHLDLHVCRIGLRTWRSRFRSQSAWRGTCCWTGRSPVTRTHGQLDFPGLERASCIRNPQPVKTQAGTPAAARASRMPRPERSSVPAAHSGQDTLPERTLRT